MDFVLNIKDLLLLFAASLSFLLAFSFFLFSKPVNKVATTFLISFLIVIFFRIILRFLDDDGRFEKYYFIFEFNRVLGLFTPPLFFLYVNYFLKDIRKLKWNFLLHFIIPFLIFIYYFIFLLKVPNSNFTHPTFTIWYNIFAIVYSFYYLIISINVYISFRRKVKEKDVVSQSNHIQVLEWVRLLIVIYFAFLVFAILAALIDSEFFRDLPFQVLSILVPLVCVKLFTMADLISLEPVPKKKYGGIKLQESIKNNLSSKLEKVVREKELFKNPDITISQVAKELKVSEQEISRFLNSERGISFNRFINKERVAYAKDLLSDPKLTEKITIEHLGYEAGFNSKTTFFNSFKKEEGITPGNFKKRAINFKS